MAKTIFEEIGGTYHEENEYLIPDLILLPDEEQPIGIWGQRMNNIKNRATEILMQILFILYNTAAGRNDSPCR